MARRVENLRPSPNEEALLLREERERRRKLRIQQVREQHKNFALQTRQNVEQRRRRELELLGEELRQQWEQQRSDKLRALQMLFEKSLQMVGQGQRMAKENEPDVAAIAQKDAENHAKAEERFREALKELKSQKLKEIEAQNRTINARKKAIQLEKERASKVAHLPTPAPNPILAINNDKTHMGKKSDVSAFASTRFHMPAATVDRGTDAKQTNAHDGAELAMKKLEIFQRDGERKRVEQMEAARLRGKKALKKEQLALDRDRLLVELEHMQQADLLRRRQQALQMPPQLFQPPQRRQEIKDEFQRDMEFAFENMYIRERKIKGTQMGNLVPEPIPEESISNQDPELDVSLDEVITSKQEKSQVQPASQDSANGTKSETFRRPGRQALKNLLNRIRTQRSDPTSGGVPAARSLVTVTSRVSERDTEVIPEWDEVARDQGVSEKNEGAKAVSESEMTINTGTLSSQPPTSSTVKPTGKPIPLDKQPKDALSSKILEFEAERKKRELELEKEKQQQMALLQELEDQKAQLDQLLRQSQQGGSHPNVSIDLEIPHYQTEVQPAGEKDVTRAQERLTPEHTQKIRECQERLLEQNRIHQQSIDMARRRLEDYQRALRTRHKVETWPPPPQFPSASTDPPLPPSLPLSSVSRTFSRLEHTEPLGSFNGPRHLMQNESDPTQKNWVSRDIEQARGPTVTTETLPFKEVPQKPFFPKTVSREPIPDGVFIRKLVPPQSVTEKPMAPVVVTIESVPPRSVTREPMPPGMVAGEQGPSQSVASEPGPSQSVASQPGSCRSVASEPRSSSSVPREPVPSRSLAREPIAPGIITTELGPSQSVTRELGPSQSAARERSPSQSVARGPIQSRLISREPLLSQSVTIETIPSQLISTGPIPSQSFSREPHSPQSVNRNSVPYNMVTRESLNLKPVTREPSPTAVSRDSHFPSPVTREVLSPQAVIRESFAPKTGPTKLLPSKTTSNSHSFSPIRTVTEDSPSLSLSPQAGLLQHDDCDSLEEQRQKQRKRLELLRQQKETLQALLHADAQTQSDVSAPEDGEQTRLELLSSLLKVIEDSNGGSLSPHGHLQLEEGSSPELPSSSQTASFPARAARPPVTRVRHGTMMREQHELSAIQEVETPVDISQTGPEDVFSLPHHRADVSLQKPYEWTRRTPQSGTMSSSSESSPPLCREKGMRTSPESSEHSSYQPLSSDSDRGAHYFGPTPTSRAPPSDTRPPAESSQLSPHRYRDPEWRSTTPLSTGSYISTDPEGCQTNALRLAAGRAQPAQLTSRFNDGYAQRIIDRYTKELDSSLSAAGKSTDSEGSVLEMLGSSLSELSLHQISERRGDGQASGVTPPSEASLTSDLIRPVQSRFSVCEDQDSFRPLIGQLADQSSCLLADHQNATMERPLGPAGQPDRRTGQPATHTERSWLDEHPEESSMRPLVGELDLSSCQDSGSSGERTGVDLGASVEATMPTCPSFLPDASNHGTSVPGLNPEPPSPLAADSFHPLPVEVTQNETSEPPAPDSSDGRLSSGELSFSANSDSRSFGGRSESERSAERFRTEDIGCSTTASCRISSPPQVLHLSQTDTSDSSSSFSLLPVEEVDEQHEVDIPVPIPSAEMRLEHCLIPMKDFLNEALSEPDSPKGILEQSQITLVSLTDTTPRDSMVSEAVWEEEEEEQKEESQTIITEEPSVVIKEYQSPTHAGKLLEVNWGSQPQEVFEQKRRALQARSARRAEEVKAKGAKARTVAKEVKAKVCAKSEEGPPPIRRDVQLDKPKMAKSALVKQQKPALAVTTVTKLYDQNQVKKNKQEMLRRTQRVYEQLEEVKQQRAVRNRQEAYANNRLKAKAFHMKTLEKLRSKQTQQ
ncbi:centrosomal protein of 295 kDa-like isoform X2 [Corythoichthys intestinalis]|uniref:centrosomal protein of 295 kDa-like isoform X2 n=1 Tax=Corythoichthys intestinalis TaxID=161448 RepID=UPI0025A5C50C|nr:centrosomal protein of 295 kDa-like isoform X2 [Corythoichthys intestinalis]